MRLKTIISYKNCAQWIIWGETFYVGKQRKNFLLVLYNESEVGTHYKTDCRLAKFENSCGNILVPIALFASLGRLGPWHEKRRALGT